MMTEASKARVAQMARSREREAAAHHGGAARASRMALAAAVARATHHLYDTPRVFDDHYAAHMLHGHWRWVVRSRLLDRLVLRTLYHRMRPVMAQVVARSRYTEDALRSAIARGVRQYVIVGAGLDTFALREPELSDAVQVFELDHPASQALKRRQIERLGTQPRNVDYVATNFERESVADALRRSRFDAAEPCFVSWLGTTFYLSEAATLATLKSIADVAAPGSELVVDFCVPEASLGPRDRDELAALKRLAARRGEPFAASYLPAQMAERLSRVGLDLVDMMSPDMLEQRYFHGRSDGFRPSRFAWVAHAKARGRHGQ